MRPLVGLMGLGLLVQSPSPAVDTAIHVAALAARHAARSRARRSLKEMVKFEKVYIVASWSVARQGILLHFHI